MVNRRRLAHRFAIASHAVHHHRLRRRPVLEVLEGRVVLSTFTVNSLGDAGSGSNDAGDLRYCINQANADDQANTIVFDASVFSTPQSIALSGGQLELEDTGGTQTITGPAAGVTISGGGTSPVFQVSSGVTASLSGLTITGGSTSGHGGGLYNEGTATLTDCTLSGNSAASAGGGVFNHGTATLALTDCTLSGNSASSDGGGLENNGNADFQGVSSSPTTESVRPAATAIVLVPHALVKGKTALKAVELTAEIDPLAPGRGVPTGTVTFELVTRVRKTVKVKTFGIATVSGGEATLTFKPNAVLNETLTIIYSGDTDFLASRVSPPTPVNMQR